MFVLKKKGDSALFLFLFCWHGCGLEYEKTFVLRRMKRDFTVFGNKKDLENMYICEVLSSKRIGNDHELNHTSNHQNKKGKKHTHIQSNFSGSKTFGTMKICSRQG